MTSESTITAAILGELVPELEHAAPLLLERSQRGIPLVGRTSATDPGFETGAVDSVLLELFKALVPYVQTVLTWGVLRVIQASVSGARESRRQIELVAMLNALVAENVRVRQAVEAIAEVLARHERAPVSADEVVRSIAAATDRVAPADNDREET
jgi:hypothetical protein